MSADSSPLISVVPENKIFIEVSRSTGNYTTGASTTVTLKNLTNAKVHYKVESTASELYYFKPRYGCLDPEQTSYVNVFLLPFDFGNPANRKHELIVQSMLAENEKEKDLPQLFEHTNQAQIVTQRVKCLHYESGKLATEPNHELLFEASFDVPFSSNISLHNCNWYYLIFDVQTSSTNLAVFPPKGSVTKLGSMDLMVIRKPLSLSDTSANTDTITIRESTEREPGQKNVTTIKCVYNAPKTMSSVTDCQRSISDLRIVD